MSSEGQQADDQELTGNRTGSRVRSVKIMAYIPKDTDISKAVGETEDSLPDKHEEDLATSLTAELLTAMRDEVQSAVGAAKKKVLRTTVKKTLRDIFLFGCEVAEEGV